MSPKTVGEGRKGKGTQADLLAQSPDAETWLLERLKKFGVDVYAGDFPTLQARIGHVIVVNDLIFVMAGRHEGKPKTYREVFEKIYSARLSTVTRGTVSNTKQSTG